MNRMMQARKKRNRRIKFVGVMISALLAALLINIGYITFTYGADFERYAVRQLIIRQNNIMREIPPAHGGILDRNRQPLIDSERVYNVFLDVNVLHSLEPSRRNPNPQEAVLQQIYEILDIPMETLRGYMAADADGNLIAPSFWRPIARHVPAYAALRLSNVPHVNLEADAVRMFPDPYFAPQVLGFVRGDAAWGLESRFQAEMAGDPGLVFRAFQTDSAPIEDIPPRNGYWLITTLDAGIQRIAQRVANDAAAEFNAEFTGIVVMNPRTSEILAAAQWPSFSLESPADGSLFTDPAVSNFWHYMNEDEQVSHWFRTWPSFFISRSFEPGSTFKPFIMAAAFEEGLISPEISRFYCAGVRTVADWDIRCHNIHGHGSLTLVESLMVSCNIAPIDIVQMLGRDRFYNFRNDFGFGDFTGIDLPGEAPVSSPGVMYTHAQLNTVELATSSIGQGFNATPIQMINAFAALINGGYIMRPHIVSQIVDDQGNVQRETSPTVVRNILSSRTSDFMRESLQTVVTPDGTGRRAVIDGYTIGGKTGTGEQGVRGDGWITTSFIGFMPVENPQFIAMAVVYNPEDTSLMASASAAVMIRDVFEGIIEYRQLPPAGAEQATGILDIGGEVLPNFSGMELRDVTPILNNMGVDFSVSGRGAVISHHIPGPDQPVPRGTPIFLYMDGNIDDLYDLTFMPSVEGMSVSRAEELIITSGLVPFVITEGPGGARPRRFEAAERNYEDDEPPEEIIDTWIVERQSPTAGQHIQRGSQVRIRVRDIGSRD